MRAIVTGDIGCYTLGALPPLSAMDTTVDMGPRSPWLTASSWRWPTRSIVPSSPSSGTPRSPIRA